MAVPRLGLIYRNLALLANIFVDLAFTANRTSHSMGLVESTLKELETSVTELQTSFRNTVTGAVVDALTIPDALQSAAVMALESSAANRATGDEPVVVLKELKVVEHAFYALLPRAAPAAYDPSSRRHGELRWLLLSTPAGTPVDHTTPRTTESRKFGARIVVVRTAEVLK